MNGEQTTQQTTDTTPASTETTPQQTTESTQQTQTPADIQKQQSEAGKEQAQQADETASALLAGDVKPDGTQQAAPAEVTPETIDAFVNDIDLKVKPDGFDKEIEGDREALKAVAPILMKLGASKEQVAELNKALVAHQSKQVLAQSKQEQELITGIISKTKEKFGADLPQVIEVARKGGLAFFGAELWNQLSTIPSFSSDHRVIEALYRFGKSFKPDTGTDGNGASGGAQKDFVTSWTGKPGGVG